LYSPGSTFKIITLTGALYSGGVKLSDIYEAPGSLDIGGAPIVNFGRNNYGTVTVQRALELSANTVFAQLADHMGPYSLVAIADSFGFDRTIGRDFLVAISLMPNPEDMTQWETAWAGAGEPVGNHPGSPAGPQVTAVQMALAGAAIANNGTIMNPYVVDRVIAANGSLLAQTTPEVFGNVASSQVITDVQTAMEGVVTSGSCYTAQIPGYVVRAKSGTAETGRGEPDSWLVGYVQAGGRNVVVALVLEAAGEGAATPRARDVLMAALAAYE
jgi:peptidoglycan glycosyltransferase